MQKPTIQAYWATADGQSLPATPAPAGPTAWQVFQPIAGRAHDTLHLVVPVAGITGIWSPISERSTLQKISWHGKIAGSPFFAPAILAFVNESLENRLLVMAEPASAECEIAWHLNQSSACYEVTVRWESAPVDNATIVITTNRESIHRLVPRLLEARLPQPPLPPADRYEPAYCTWYAFHADMDARRVEQAARLARDVGFGTLIVDDGWSYNARQRVGTSIAQWHRFQGDWTPAADKFPDFAGHVQRVRALGLRYLLWVAPFLVGNQSRSATEHAGQLLESWLGEEGFQTIDPRSPAGIDRLTQKLANLVAFAPIDGFKVDYDYALHGPGKSSLHVDDAYASAVRRLIAACQAIHPQLEWNLVCNLFAASVTSCLRCIDVPFDAASNRMHIGNMKPLTAGRALQSDPALWSVHDEPSAVHQHIIPTLFCVPSIGSPILELPADHLAILRSWLGFYRRHQPLLNHGTFDARWQAGDYQSFHAAHGNREIIAVFSAYPCAIEPGRTALLINAGSTGTVTLDLRAPRTIEVQDADGHTITPARQIGSGIHAVHCPVGCVLHLKD